jgi:hypothetical protein
MFRHSKRFSDPTHSESEPFVVEPSFDKHEARAYTVANKNVSSPTIPSAVFHQILRSAWGTGDLDWSLHVCAEDNHLV